MSASLPIDVTLLRPGLRLAVGLSGGADSVALLCALHQQARELGLVLHAAHLHHGLRGAEADADLAFCRTLAAQLDIPFHESRVDTAAEAKPAPNLSDPARSKPAESIEEAARRLRYAWFQQLLSKTPLDAVATAHTLDDQAETVLAKFLRGAWTEGLSAIHPKLESPEGGVILRPLLATTRAQIEEFLRALGQPWRTDSSNADTAFTRNRIRHELLPLLEAWNPRLREHLAQMAQLARDEEAWWQSELARLAPQLLLPGRPVRGGGRAAAPGLESGLAIDVTRLAALSPALQRRLLRHAAAQLGAAPDFPATESLRTLALSGRAGQKRQLAHGLSAERTHRELRLSAEPASAQESASPQVTKYVVPIPGQVAATAFSLALRVDLDPASEPPAPPATGAPSQAILRPWKPGDRVRLRHSSGPRKVKEVLERLRVTGHDRTLWPVLEIDGRILWMRGVEVEPLPGLRVTAAPLEPASSTLALP
ncbi:MAG TPA: tRNA lysidine(34) synthetase TilS [Terracidiphilus sp.]|nr:tRNA lysidine(34) synthetase TilS [Terracidiphilus sp.]